MRIAVASFIFALAASVAASSSHSARSIHGHNGVAARSGHADVVGRDVSSGLTGSNRRRANAKRCPPRQRPVKVNSAVPEASAAPSSEAAPVAESKAAVISAEPTPTPSKEAEPTPAPFKEAEPVVTPSKEPEQVVVPSKEPEPSPSPEPVVVAPTPEPVTPSGGGGGGISIPGLSVCNAGTNSAEGTFYKTGMTACGETNQDTDYIAAVSFLLFDAFPGSNGNPNQSPICGRKIRAWRKKNPSNKVTVRLTDRCADCYNPCNVDFSPSAFSQLASFDEGRLHDLEWEWA